MSADDWDYRPTSCLSSICLSPQCRPLTNIVSIKHCLLKMAMVDVQRWPICQQILCRWYTQLFYILLKLYNIMCLWHKEYFIHYSMKMLIFSHPIYYPDIRGSTIHDLSILMRNIFPCRIPISITPCYISMLLNYICRTDWHFLLPQLQSKFTWHMEPNTTTL